MISQLFVLSQHGDNIVFRDYCGDMQKGSAFSTPLCRAGAENHRNAYATMMYMGTPRDYEFYVAIRVLLKCLAALNIDADFIVIASVDVPT
ncbi:hypothetical protein QN277_002680 [Acacia crassicarpa]|uniref:Uncharacterized protein n=1 Tax=Acacia crassicarpa TaxID=499986 RepID=A0AAE1TJU4_9FABA|nr:hypothetical protein QN277_002680 [Acacia crassicarpa]